MKSANFQIALRYLLANEGGFVNHPADRGGATNMGITQHTLSDWRSKLATVEDIKALTVDEASDIYFSRYWLVAGCGSIDSLPIAISLFDTAVISGAHTATLYCQIAINKILNATGIKPLVTEDGRAGPTTISALNRITDHVFILTYHDLLISRFNRIVDEHPTQNVFLSGWTNRAKRLLTLLEASTPGTAIV